MYLYFAAIIVINVGGSCLLFVVFVIAIAVATTLLL